MVIKQDGRWRHWINRQCSAKCDRCGKPIGFGNPCHAGIRDHRTGMVYRCSFACTNLGGSVDAPR